MTLIDSQYVTTESSPAARGERVNLNVHDDTNDNIASQVMTLFQTARTHRRDLVRRWDRNYRFLRNRFWSDDRPGWMPSPAVPEIFPIVASMVGWMTDNSFHHTIAPASLPYSPHNFQARKIADDLQLVMDSSYHVNDEEAEITKSLWDSQIYGTGILKTGWDMTLAGGKGDCITKRVDPYGFYPDPAARSLDDANYFIEVKRMSIQSLDRRFPGSARFFRSGGITADIDQSPDGVSAFGARPSMANPGAIAPATGAGNYGLVGQSRVHILEDPGVDVFECWMREHYIYSNDQGDIRVTDGWRCIVVAGNHVLLNEPADELWSHGSHPYSRFVPHDIGEFWGISLVELLIPTQDSINRILAAIQHNVELTGNPVWRETQNSAVGRTRITNKPGQRVQTRPSQSPQNEVGWVNPPQLHNAMPELLRYMLQRMEAISGLSAITRGGSVPGRNAQGVIDALQEAAFVRIRIQQRSLETTLRRVGKLKASLIIEFYDTPRFMAVVGPDGEQSTLFLRGKHFYLDNGMGEELPLEFTLLVDAGSGSHTSRKVREDQAITLYTLGAIDELTLLHMLEIPNAQGIYERVMELKGSGAMQPPGQRQRARA